MSLTIEIQISTGGLSDSWFSPLTTLTDNGTGFSFTHAPVIAGQQYIYRARRRDDTQLASCQYSDWVYDFARAPYPLSKLGVMKMADPITGAETEFGLGIEVTEGGPVKPPYKAESTQGSINRQVGPIFSTALRNTPARVYKHIDGMAVFAGSLTVELTPEGSTPSLYVGALGTPTTVQVGGAGGTPLHYRHRFKNTNQRNTLTGVQRKGQSFFVYPGMSVSTLNLSLNPSQTTPLEATIGLMAMDEVIYNNATTVGMDTAQVDNLKPYSVNADVTVFLGGTPLGTVKDQSVSVTTGMKEKRVLRGLRGVAQHFKTKSDISSTMNFYLDDGLDNIKTIFGTPGATQPFGPARNQGTTEVRTTIITPKNNLGYINRLDLVFPAAVFTEVNDPVTGPDEVVQNATIVPEYSIPDGTDFYIDIYNSMTYAQVVATGTPFTPPNDSVQTYS